MINLGEDHILDLKETLGSHKGNHPLQFTVYEMEDEIKVTLAAESKKYRFAVNYLQPWKIKKCITNSTNSLA